MKKFYNPLGLLLINLFAFSAPVNSQSGTIKQVKLTRFELQSSALISSNGAEISSPEYKSKVYWFPVRVPSTVLTGLVANNVYPDPYSGLNNMLIPDASDEFNKSIIWSNTVIFLVTQTHGKSLTGIAHHLTFLPMTGIVVFN